MLHTLTDNELRNLCREKLESLEHWLRRLIDQTLSAKYGDYFSHVDDAGNRLIKKRIVDSLEERVQKEPNRYKRKIDAVLHEDEIAIICNPRFYAFFKPALEDAFPDGASEARTFLMRLLDPRNKLAHANPTSLRQAEQVICYSNDVIDSLKAYYAAIGMQQEYNVPLILKVTDSFGNVFYRNQMFENSSGSLFKTLAQEPLYFLRPGDVLTVEVEVDPAFSPDDYTVSWESSAASFRIISEAPKVVIGITTEHVAHSFSVNCTVTSKKDWHRMGRQGVDGLMLCYRVLPPQ